MKRKDVGKDKQRVEEPCRANIRPIAVDTPQTAKGGRGVGANSGEKLKGEDKNVPYKKKIDNS